MNTQKLLYVCYLKFCSMTILSSYFYGMHGLVIVSHLWWNKSKTADLWKTECHFVKLHSYLMVKFASWCTDFLKLLIKKCALFFKNNITKVEYCPVLNMCITDLYNRFKAKKHNAVFFLSLSFWPSTKWEFSSVCNLVRSCSFSQPSQWFKKVQM